MNLSKPFILRPVMTTLLMVGVLLFGLLAYVQLPVSDLPDLALPTIVVTASLPGADPQMMARSVATPLEKQLSAVPGIRLMSSSSVLGATHITLQFDLDRNIDGAASDVQAALSAATRSLPSDMPDPPTYRKINPAAAPVIYLSMSSDTVLPAILDDYAENQLAQRISMLSGVAQVNVYGSQKYALRILANPGALASRHIGIDALASIIAQNNVNQSTGSLDTPHQNLPIYADGQLKRAAAYRPLIISYQNGAPVRLQDVAHVIDSVQNNQAAAWFNHSRAIILAVQRQPGANTLAVINEIKQLLPDFQASLPAAIELSTVYDRSISIHAAVSEVKAALSLAIILVILVIFLFLRSLPATIIPAIAMPFSIIGTFFVMHLLHFSIDTISLMALTLTVGFIVDDAIVMLENITRHIEMGKTPFQAALAGSSEIGFTIFSITISLVAVFIPVLFMGGIIGRLFHEFAVITVVAILLSGLISITLTPLLASRLLRTKKQAQKPGFAFLKHSEAVFQKAQKLYQKTLTWGLEHPRRITDFFIISVVLTVVLCMVIPKGFMPSQDINQLLAFTEGDTGISFAEMKARQLQVAKIIQKTPNVQSLVSVVGAGGASDQLNNGRIFIRLLPHKDRKLNADAMVQVLRKQVSHVPGIKVYVQNIPAIPMGKVSKSRYQYALQSTDLALLRDWSHRLQKQLEKLPMLEDVTSDLSAVTPQITVVIDRKKMAQYGVAMQSVQDALKMAYAKQSISTIYDALNNYDVILQVDPKFQKDPDALRHIYVSTQTGSLVPLGAIAHFKRTSAPLAVNHIGVQAAATLSFNLKPGTAMSDATAAIGAAYLRLHPPATLSAGFQGSAKLFQSSQGTLGLLLLITIFVIYIILGILYESFIHPLTILAGLPSAGLGALLGLLLFYRELDIYGFIGLIMLVGIVKKNAIMMIDFAIVAEREQKLSSQAAIYQACSVRFRPIMMTTLSALFGALPLALAQGPGAEKLRPLGIAVVGGLCLSQLLTLYITPVIYVFFEKYFKKVAFQ